MNADSCALLNCMYVENWVLCPLGHACRSWGQLLLNAHLGPDDVFTEAVMTAIRRDRYWKQENFATVRGEQYKTAAWEWDIVVTARLSGRSMGGQGKETIGRKQTILSLW